LANELLDLLRPPPHRGPLIAAGAVMVTLGVALEEIRLNDKLPTGVHLVILGLAAGVIYPLGVQVRQEGRPYAFQSVLLVSGLLLLFPALLTLSDVLGADFGEFPAGAVLYVAYCGNDPAEIDPLRSLGKVQADTVTEKPYAEVLEEAHPPEGIRPVVGNTLVEELSGDCIDAISAAYAQGTAGRVVFLRSLGGAMGRISPDATAFAHRAAQALIVSAKFLPLDAPEEAVAAARAEWQTIGRHGIGSYAGFLASDTADDIASLWPPATLARLTEVKRAWDPDNVFRRNFNIRP
jgi:hypothetical protein